MHFRELQTSDLRELLNSPDQLDAHFEATQSTARERQQQQSLLIIQQLKQSNNTTATQNISQQPVLDELRRQTMDASQQLSAMQQDTHATLQAYSALNRDTGNQTTAVQQRIKEEIDTLDQSSEQLSQKLMSGSVTVDAFIKEYRNMRRLFHSHSSTLENL